MDKFKVKFSIDMTQNNTSMLQMKWGAVNIDDNLVLYLFNFAPKSFTSSPDM